jgi:hypothetical protein
MVIEFYRRCCTTIARASSHALPTANKEVYGYWLTTDGREIAITSQAVDQCLESMEVDNHYPNFRAHPLAKPISLKDRLNPVPYLRLCASKGKEI